MQWSAYGDSDFGGAKGWLANSLREARAQGLELVLGLYMDPSYYQRLEQLDGEGLSSYWKAQLGRSLGQYTQLRDGWQLAVDGWYLPMELDDLHFRESSRRIQPATGQALAYQCFQRGQAGTTGQRRMAGSTGKLGLDCLVAGRGRYWKAASAGG